jgi:hypothetical protein
VFGREAVRHMPPQQQGTIIFTGATRRSGAERASPLLLRPNSEPVRSPRAWRENSGHRAFTSPRSS